ncbi:hypothetical protein SAMN04487761_10617 [Lachnospiraceae bacterium C7]|nr:hypothetical protein SAMN04487761_10617 [Lachnospiraceae bacterium C7]
MAEQIKKKDNKRKPKPVVRVSYDEMEAFIMLPEPSEEDEMYTKEDLSGALTAAGVKYGIKEELLDKIIEDKAFGFDHSIAIGTPSVDGVDGYFEFNFNSEFSRKPTVRPDGSVDYWSVHLVEIVEEGQVIAIYHEPIPGKDGMSVRGKLKKGKRGRPLPPLKGKGFDRSEDNKIYTSKMDGKIDKKNDRIVISPVYEVYGNADLSTGNIDFNGDVIVHGNVTSGMKIKAQGSVTVDGVTEACEIEAQGDIVLRGGMLGKKRGRLFAKGSIIAKFVEYAIVESQGPIEANNFLNSKVYCEELITMNGKNGSIVGGEVSSIKGIVANTLGNDGELKTIIQVGVGVELLKRVNTLENELGETQSLVDKITEGIRQFDELGKEKNVDVRKDERRVALVRAKVAKQAELAVRQEKVSHVHSLLERAKGANIKVMNQVFPGVQIAIDSNIMPIKSKNSYVKFIINEENILVMVPM